MPSTPRLTLSTLVLASCLVLLVLAASACAAPKTPAAHPPLLTSTVTETPTAAQQEAETATTGSVLVDTPVLLDSETPSVDALSSATATLADFPTGDTATVTVTPPSAEEQLATFYAEATQTATAAGTYGTGPRPTITRPPTRTPSPTPTPTITPTPRPPNAQLMIAKPGMLSKVISPIHSEMFVKPGDDGRVELDLIGEDGRYIARQLLDYTRYIGKSIGISPQIPFTISAVAETSRLVVSTSDKFGRKISLTSVDLILLSIGDNELNLAGSPLEPYLIRSIKPGDIISGGILRLSGLARPVNDTPIIFELIDENGTVVGSQKITVPPPSGDLSHTPFTIDIPYQISEVTPVRLTIRQESGGRLPGTVALSSLEVILAP